MSSAINILIADDIAAMRTILRRELFKFGYDNITEASNGEQALEKLQLHKFHLALLDINMPIKNGLDVLREIRAKHPDVFVVMISADSSVDHIKATLELGVNGFVVKPYSSTKISSLIKKFNQHLLQLGLAPAAPFAG